MNFSPSGSSEQDVHDFHLSYRIHTRFTENLEKTLWKAKKKAPFALLASLALAFSADVRGDPGATEPSPQHCPAEALVLCHPQPGAHRNNPRRPPQSSLSQVGELHIRVGSQQRIQASAGCPGGVNTISFTGIPPRAEFLLEYPNL